MSSEPLPSSGRPAPYGSAKDLPSFQELKRQIQGGKLLTLVIARDQRKKLLEIEGELERLTRVVDDFYDRLGARNWIFHDLLSIDKVEQLLADTADARSAEERLIELYLDEDSTKWWRLRLRAHDGLRQRHHQIDRAHEHYRAGQFDSCVLQLIAVMDGFVNDFEPAERKGLHSRHPDDMAAWDSVVGHHMGLSHAMATFTRTVKKRVDEEVFEVYRHGIVHGSVVRFDNVIVATKAWNMLFAVADWATATQKAAETKEPDPTWGDLWSSLSRQASYKKYQRDFVSTTLPASAEGFASVEIVQLAAEFLEAWQFERWGLVAKFTPPMLLSTRSDGQSARQAKDTFAQHDLTSWTIQSVTHDQASTASIKAAAVVNGDEAMMHFRMVFWDLNDNVGIPGQDEGRWTLAVWAPHTYFEDPDLPPRQ